MKQGSASSSSSGSTKTEPMSKAISPGAVSRIGNAVSVDTRPEPIVMGQGLKAPMAGQSSHKSGSQGKY